MRSKHFRENPSNIDRVTAQKTRYTSNNTPLLYNIFACDGHQQDKQSPVIRTATQINTTTPTAENWCKRD